MKSAKTAKCQWKAAIALVGDDFLAMQFSAERLLVKRYHGKRVPQSIIHLLARNVLKSVEKTSQCFARQRNEVINGQKR